MPDLCAKFWRVTTPLIGLCFFAMSCGQPTGPNSHSSDVVTDHNTEYNTFLFYSEGTQIVRRTCPDNTRIFDRNTCAADERRVQAAPFWAVLEGKFGADLPDWDRQVSEIYVLIRRVDERLFQMVNVEPDPARQDLLPEIERIRNELALLAVEIAEYQSQITRIEDALRQGDDPDLRQQLAINRERLALKTGERDEQEAALRSLRKEYVQANASLLDPVQYQELNALRKSYVDDLADARRGIDRALEQQINLARAVKKVQDQTFVHSHLRDDPRSGTFRVVAEFSRLFMDLDLEQRTSVAPWDGRRFEFEVTTDQPLEYFMCDATVNHPMGCVQFAIEHWRDGQQVQRQVLTLRQGENLALRGGYPNGRFSHPELRNLMGRSLRGTIRAYPICRMMGTWNLRNDSCKVVYQ